MPKTCGGAAPLAHPNTPRVHPPPYTPRHLCLDRAIHPAQGAAKGPHAGHPTAIRVVVGACPRRCPRATDWTRKEHTPARAHKCTTTKLLFWGAAATTLHILIPPSPHPPPQDPRLVVVPSRSVSWCVLVRVPFSSSPPLQPMLARRVLIQVSHACPCAYTRSTQPTHPSTPPTPPTPYRRSPAAPLPALLRAAAPVSWRSRYV